ncbi:hypothetical protein [Geofilum rubicundum]|uniref:Uncharacterized protein n=1 Tax=Geofilum rubicundum JCM 15548 TaxID=1236989 RepID=A0A0E9LYH7_9BACT|nr:hypothetical protein [Geofilum rubicundum]GAO30627.1 hypothetical protein JCM15548_12916 [Geofilum rubicundum JCM 15548]
MKSKKIKLDVDFIGSQEALSIEEEKALSEFFKKRKKASMKEKMAFRARALKSSKTKI